MRNHEHQLAYREFWTPRECARILGRGAEYWRSRYRQGHVDGYIERGALRIRLYINAASARAWLQSKQEARIDRAVQKSGAMTEFREMLKTHPEILSLRPRLGDRT